MKPNAIDILNNEFQTNLKDHEFQDFIDESRIFCYKEYYGKDCFWFKVDLWFKSFSSINLKVYMKIKDLLNPQPNVKVNNTSFITVQDRKNLYYIYLKYPVNTLVYCKEEYIKKIEKIDLKILLTEKK
jgi:hypothetical protein